MDGTRITSDYGMEGSEDFKEFTFYQNHGVINAEQNKTKSRNSQINDLDKLPTTDKKTLPLETKEKESQ